MTRKERVRAAFARSPADRVPVFMWFHPSTTSRLARLLEVRPEFVGEAMGNDVRQTWVNNNFAMEGILHEREGESHTDFWGIEWTRGGAFNQISLYPLGGASREEVLGYHFPQEHQSDLLAQMDTVVRDSEGWFIGCDVSPCVFEMYWRLRGMENTLAEMGEDRALAGVMFGRCADFAVQLSEAACERFPLDWLWTGDDVASQQSLLMSPAMWRSQIKPHLKRVFDVGKRHTLPVAYHCCGALRPIISDLIDMGMDVLNPVQASCPGMDALQLKREFGKDIVFMGGIDTVQLIPYGTADEVQRYASRFIEGMTADGGGYILAASHTIPPETPDENIFALYGAAGISREEIFDSAASIRRRCAGNR
jgi:uroporphyrinogen decarboxylase